LLAEVRQAVATFVSRNALENPMNVVRPPKERRPRRGGTVQSRRKGEPKPPSSPNGYGDGPAETPADRDAKTGRFGPGNTAALGHVNPTARARAELQKALIAAVTPADIEALAKRLLADALSGQVPSAELLLKYVVGKPAKADDPDRVALEAWRLIQAWPMLAEFAVAVVRNVNPAVAAAFAHVMPNDLAAVQQRLDDADDECDHWGNSYFGKQTSAVIERRAKKGK
jgi:hypothetical protein